MKILRISNREMLFELLAGIAAYSVPAEIIICIIADRILYETIGFICGTAAAVFFVIHMAIAIDDSVYMGEKGALNHIRKGYIIRILVLIAVILAVFFLKLGGMVSFLFGLASLKVSAYLQPLTHKIIKNLRKGR